MDKPTGLRTLDLTAVSRGAGDNVRCELAQVAYNGARRGKLAYQGLTFLLAIVLAIAAVYALLAFGDEEEARGFLGLVTAIGALVTSGVFAKLAKSASEDEKAMWARVESSCGGSAPQPPAAVGAGTTAG
jgi:hypothetical protein